MSKSLDIGQDLVGKLVEVLEPYKNKYSKNELSFDINKGTEILEIYANYKEREEDSNLATCILLRINICADWEQLHIPNIFIPMFMQHNGIGKMMISKVFEISEKYCYELFLIMMVESFYNRMIKRGALPSDEYDAVKIVAETILI